MKKTTTGNNYSSEKYVRLSTFTPVKDANNTTYQAEPFAGNALSFTATVGSSPKFVKVTVNINELNKQKTLEALNSKLHKHK